MPVQIGYPRRFDPAFVAARDAVRSGEPRPGHDRALHDDGPGAPAGGVPRGSGGVFRDCSVHDFDAVRWVTGREVVEVYALGAVDPTAPAEMYADDGDCSPRPMLLTMDDGSIGVVSNTRTNGRGYDVRLEVHGTDDSVAAGLDDGLPLRSTQPGVTWPAGPAHTFFMDRLAEAFRRRARDVLRRRRRGAGLPVHGRGRDGDGLGRGGGHPVGARAPSGAHRRGRPLTRRHLDFPARSRNLHLHTATVPWRR